MPRSNHPKKMVSDGGRGPDGEHDYWLSELGQSQEFYRFFLQSNVTLLYYSYGAMFAIAVF